MKDVRQLSCVSQDVEPPESSAISRKGIKVLGPIRRTRFTQSALRQASIRENKGPSLGKFQVKVPHQRSPYAPKFEDRSHEETERPTAMRPKQGVEACQKRLQTQNDKATFHSLSEEWVLAGYINKGAGRERVCARFRSLYAYGQQERPLTMPSWRP